MIKRSFAIGLAALFCFGCSTLQPGEDIQIDCRWGVGGINHLDTRAGIFAKDMVTEREIVVNLQLSLAEKLRIVDSARSMGFFTHPHQEKREALVFSSLDTTFTIEWDIGNPCWTAIIRITTAEEENWVQWDCRTPVSEDWRQMEALLDFIINIIESKPAFQSLPRAPATL